MRRRGAAATPKLRPSLVPVRVCLRLFVLFVVSPFHADSPDPRHSREMRSLRREARRKRFDAPSRRNGNDNHEQNEQSPTNTNRIATDIFSTSSSTLRDSAPQRETCPYGAKTRVRGSFLPVQNSCVSAPSRLCVKTLMRQLTDQCKASRFPLEDSDMAHVFNAEAQSRRGRVRMDLRKSPHEFLKSPHEFLKSPNGF